MNVPRAPHRWSVTPRRAIEIQRRLATRISKSGSPGPVRLVAGADAAFTDRECVAAVVVWDLRRREVVEHRVARRKLTFPYVPGLLSFREIPAILAAVRKLRAAPDVFIFDGQGYAHPRRFGLACHAALLIGRPGLGCAKSLLIGACDPPGAKRGSAAPLIDGAERIGAALRTQDAVKPVYISIGHRLSLPAAVRLALRCTTRYRLPEPVRLADRLVARAKTA